MALRALTFDKGLNGSMGTVAANGNFSEQKSRADGSQNRVDEQLRRAKQVSKPDELRRAAQSRWLREQGG